MKADLDYIELAINALKEMLGYVNGEIENLSEAVFLDNIMMRNAMLMNLIVVGETLGKVSLETQLAYPSKTWKQAKFARNFYVHQYEGIEWPTVYETVTTITVPTLDWLRHIKEDLQKQENNATH